MFLNKREIQFHFNKKDRKLFKPEQLECISHIEKLYVDLLNHCVDQVKLPQTSTHKEWIASRVKLHTNTSLMRLLYLTETFCDVTKKFNSVSSAALIKSMVEIPLHLGYIAWIVTKHNDFEEIKNELSKIAFGNRDKNTGLTFGGKVNARQYYERADEMMIEIFKEKPSISLNIFESLYKEANATGHHNYEGREMLCGIRTKDTWNAKDRKELYQFYINDIFRFLLHCDSILSTTSIFLNAIDHYLKYLPEYYRKKAA